MLSSSPLLLLSLLLLLLLLSPASPSSLPCSSHSSTSSSLPPSRFRSLPPLPRPSRLIASSPLPPSSPTSPSLVLLNGGIATASNRQIADDASMLLYDVSTGITETLETTSFGKSPLPRFGHAALTWKSSVFFLGGFTQVYSGEIWRADVPGFTVSQNSTWRAVNNTAGSGDGHEAYGHTANVIYGGGVGDGEAVVVSFGGVAAGGVVTDKLTVTVLTDSSTDSTPACSPSSPSLPPGRACSDYTPLRLDTTSHQLTSTFTPSLPSPSPRANHAAIVLEGCLYVSGGVDVLSGTIAGDLWKLCPTAPLSGTTDYTQTDVFSWSLISAANSATFVPVPRYGHVAASLSAGRIILHGGAGNWPNLFVNEVVEYDVSMNVFSTLTDSIGPSSAVRHHSASTVPDGYGSGTALVYFGGETPAGNTNEVFATNFTAGICSEGHAQEYCDLSETVVCRPCTAGTFAVPGDYECTACEAGTYAAAPAAAECTKCGRGSYGTGTSGGSATSHCSLCAAGTFSNVLGAPDVSSCSQCPAGSFSPSPGHWNCTACGQGTFSSPASSICSDCGPGTYSLSSAPACTPCTAGRFQSNSLQSTCDPCTAGSSSLGNADSCTLCLPGYVAPSSAAPSCSPCAAGTYQAAGGRTSCDPCAAGKASSTTAADAETTCLVCGKGKYSPAAGAAACVNCEPGKYQPSLLSSSCLLCAVGKYSVATAAEEEGTCTSCPVGRFTASAGSPSSASCDECPVGTYSLSGAGMGCQACPRGRYTGTVAAAKQFECDRCGRNTFSTLGQTSCSPCPSGTFAHTGYSTCVACAPVLAATNTPAEIAATLPFSGSLQHFYLADEIMTTWLNVGTGSSYSTSGAGGPEGETTGVLTAPPSQTTPTAVVPLDFAVPVALVLQGFVRLTGAASGGGAGEVRMELEISTADDPGTYTLVLVVPFDGAVVGQWQFMREIFHPIPSQTAFSATVNLVNASPTQTVEWAGPGLFNSPSSSCACGDGEYLNLDTPDCRTCDPQPECRAASAECYRCPAGHSCTAGVMVQCPPGQFSWGGSLACSPCEPGWICENGVSLPCGSDGSVETSPGSGSCGDCGEGMECGNGIERVCGPGTYSPGGRGKEGRECDACEPGKYAKGPGSAECQDCAPGTTSNHGSAVCAYCGRNELTAEFGAFPCVSCGGNSSTPAPGAGYLVASYSALVEEFSTGDFAGSPSASRIAEGALANFTAEVAGGGGGTRVSAYFIAPETGSFEFSYSGGGGGEAVNVTLGEGEKRGSATGVPRDLLEGQWYLLSLEVSFGGVGGGEVELSVRLPAGTTVSPVPLRDWFTASIPSECPYVTIESVVHAGPGACPWNGRAATTAEIAATLSNSPCDGTAPRCLNGTGTEPGSLECHGIPFYGNACGENSNSWHQKGGTSKDRGCDWVSAMPRDRCAVTDADNVPAHEACRSGCYCCDPSDPCQVKPVARRLV